MKRLALTDIRPPRVYALVREEFRRQIIEIKRPRRISVGPVVTLVFENRATMIFQIEEMARAENLDTREKIQAEIDIYNKVLPDNGELAATLLVEITDMAALESTLQSLLGLQNHVWLVVEGRRVQARFDPEQFRADKFAAVQYLRFPVERLDANAIMSLQIDHPNYLHSTPLGVETRQSIARDLQ